MNQNSKAILIVLLLALAALALLTLIVVLIVLAPAFQPLGPVHTPTAAGSRTVTGLVRDVITGQAIPNAQVRAGTGSVLTDESGTFSIPVPAGETIHISAIHYEDQDLLPASDTVLVELVRDPQATYELVHTYQMQHEYGRQYDLLHPDVQALFSRDDFVRYMERTVDYEIVARSYGDAVLLPTWTFQGRTYTDVAQVPFILTIRRAGQEQTQNDAGHLARAHGTWRWFRGPISPATATPGWPATATPVWPASPTPAQPVFPVGSWVQVTARNLNVRSGAGTGHAVVTVVSYGTRLRVLAGPTIVGSTPWYQITDEGTVQGWCNGTYLALSSPPTPVLWTPTTGPWFPVGSWTQVSSPDGRLNIRQGPGTGYAVVAVTYNGTRLRIVAGPTVVSGTPWYEVVDDPQTFQGWCNGQYLTPTGPPPPTVTATPTTQPDFPPGTPVMVASPDGQLNIRSGPGVQYVILRTVPNGTRLRIVSGPTRVDGTPWYLVADEGQTFQGWCNGHYLVVAPVTPTPTSTIGPYFPVGAWVQVQSPDGKLNVRQGPGTTYPVVHVAHNGDQFRILAGPTWARRMPWYEVIDSTGTIQGWCSGRYLVLLPATPTPTSTHGNARFTELQFCVIPPGGGAADCSGSFSHPVYEVYIVWDYENMQSGMTARREWYFDGQHLRTIEGQWDYARYGAQGTVWDIKMWNNNGIQPGTYRLELYLNNVKQQERSFTISY